MPRPRSKNTQAALNDIAAGMTQSEAARKHGVDQGLLSRMLKPKEKTISLKLTISELACVSCMLSPDGDLHKKFDNAILKLQDKKS